MARETTRKSTARRSTGKATKRVAKGKSRARASTVAKSTSVARRKSAGKASAAAPAKRAESTAQLITLVSRLVARALAARLTPKGIGYGQLPVLLCLWEEDGLTQKELSQRVRIEAPTMVRTLDRMEREGLVERVRSETDRRQIHIRLTRKGKTLQKSLVPLAGEVNDIALGGIGRKEQGQLNDSLSRLIANLEMDAQVQAAR